MPILSFRALKIILSETLNHFASLAESTDLETRKKCFITEILRENAAFAVIELTSTDSRSPVVLCYQAEKRKFILVASRELGVNTYNWLNDIRDQSIKNISFEVRLPNDVESCVFSMRDLFGAKPKAHR